MARATASLLALALGAAAIVLASCGEGDAQLLPGETAREITANLDAVKQLADEGDCAGAESAARQVSEQVEALGGIDPRLKRALRDGADRLNEVVDECEESTTEAIAPATIPEEEGTRDGDREKEKEREKEKAEEEGAPSLPPQAKGEGKGVEDGNGGPPGGEKEGGDDEEGPSGGLGAGSPAEEGE